MAQVSPLRAVVRVDDAGSYWRITLECGHKLLRPKMAGPPTVSSRPRCDECVRPNRSGVAPIDGAAAGA